MWEFLEALGDLFGVPPSAVAVIVAVAVVLGLYFAIDRESRQRRMEKDVGELRRQGEDRSDG